MPSSVSSSSSKKQSYPTSSSSQCNFEYSIPSQPDASKRTVKPQHEKRTEKTSFYVYDSDGDVKASEKATKEYFKKLKSTQSSSTNTGTSTLQ